MKLRNPFWIRISAFALAWLARIWIGSLHIRQASADGRRHPLDPRTERCIYAVWHGSILSLLQIKSPFDVLVSQHADGEIIAQTCRFLNIGVVRGSTTRGGMTGALKIARSRVKRHVLITPDGPRGPRQRMQMGTIALASMTGLPIVLIGMGNSAACRLKSWDRLILPCPGSLTCAALSEPIQVPPGLSRSQLEEHRSRIERRFLHLTELAERWAESGIKPSPSDLRGLAEVASDQRMCA